jgi:LysR family hydrogen peroxide-inducible transcriptional activator
MPEGHCFRSQVLAYCSATRSDQRPSVRFESGSFQTLIRLVDAGMGATVLPALVVRDLDPERRRADGLAERFGDPPP